MLLVSCPLALVVAHPWFPTVSACDSARGTWSVSGTSEWGKSERLEVNSLWSSHQPKASGSWRSYHPASSGGAALRHIPDCLPEVPSGMICS